MGTDNDIYQSNDYHDNNNNNNTVITGTLTWILRENGNNIVKSIDTICRSLEKKRHCTMPTNIKTIIRDHIEVLLLAKRKSLFKKGPNKTATIIAATTAAAAKEATTGTATATATAAVVETVAVVETTTSSSSPASFAQAKEGKRRFDATAA